MRTLKISIFGKKPTNRAYRIALVLPFYQFLYRRISERFLPALEKGNNVNWKSAAEFKLNSVVLENMLQELRIWKMQIEEVSGYGAKGLKKTEVYENVCLVDKKLSEVCGDIDSINIEFRALYSEESKDIERWQLVLDTFLEVVVKITELKFPGKYNNLYTVSDYL